jgi:hypothetical protein
MFNSKECVKTCNNSNILSATEDICYNLAFWSRRVNTFQQIGY